MSLVAPLGHSPAWLPPPGQCLPADDPSGRWRQAQEWVGGNARAARLAVVGALGADAAKSSSLLESQIRGWLEAHGWTYGRESTGQRRRGYKQPAVWPPRIDEDESLISDTRRTQAVMNEGNDDEPF